MSLASVPSSILIPSSSLSSLTISALASGVAPLSKRCTVTQVWPNLTRLLAQSNVTGPKCPINLLPSKRVSSVLSRTCIRSITGFNVPIWIATSRYPQTFTWLLHSPYILLGAATILSSRSSWRTPRSPPSDSLSFYPAGPDSSSATFICCILHPRSVGIPFSSSNLFNTDPSPSASSTERASSFGLTQSLSFCWTSSGPCDTKCTSRSRREFSLYCFLEVSSKKILHRLTGSPSHSAKVRGRQELIFLWVDSLFQIVECLRKWFFLNGT